MNKIKLKLVGIINGLLVLGYLFGITYLLDSKIEVNLKLLLLILIINGFYWYYKSCISKIK